MTLAATLEFSWPNLARHDVYVLLDGDVHAVLSLGEHVVVVSLEEETKCNEKCEIQSKHDYHEKI